MKLLDPDPLSIQTRVFSLVRIPEQSAQPSSYGIKSDASRDAWWLSQLNI